ncbi:glutathione S-transferase family protein [Pseudomonas segetis]|uniref:Glutathione S-transferase n=1 Tax=Pseudomonas segetis TaxID=298908 RepID=A0A239I9X0_9PSED|nr:glutathione S-transferase family protein [Pseudomonas segetis]SNS89134.1 Glutathione S-transferase [Pseudomonas segetis]
MSCKEMTLFYSPASPFARKVIVLLHETRQLDNVELFDVQLSPVSPSGDVIARNPSGKIPALELANGDTLHDSRVILDYLDHQHGGEPLIPRDGAARWQRLTLASLADAILDAAILIRYETFLRPKELHWPTWLDAQQEKIERGLAELETQAASDRLQCFNIASIGIACALGYLDFRQPQLGWRARFACLASWYEDVSQRESMRSTQPPA